MKPVVKGEVKIEDPETGTSTASVQEAINPIILQYDSAPWQRDGIIMVGCRPEAHQGRGGYKLHVPSKYQQYSQTMHC